MSTTKSEEIFSAQLAEEMVKRTDKLQDATVDMAMKVKQAREFLAWSALHVRGLWIEWCDEANQSSRQINEVRMAFDRESKSLLATGKDVADFFNSEPYLKAHAILKETVSLLDRFAELKQAGTLDAFAEFILKVTVK